MINQMRVFNTVLTKMGIEFQNLLETEGRDIVRIGGKELPAIPFISTINDILDGGLWFDAVDAISVEGLSYKEVVAKSAKVNLIFFLNQTIATTNK